MAWRRGKGKESTSADGTPPAGPSADAIEDLPVLREEGTTGEREAYKQIKAAEADLKRLERKEARARKKEEKRQRQIDRNIAKVEKSKDAGPLVLLLTLAVTNGVAVAYMLIVHWWPEWQLVPAIYLEDHHELEIVVLCYIVFSLVATWMLSDNRSPEYLEKARHAMMVYFMLGIIAIFVGMLVGFIIMDMELMDIDWMFWQWAFVYVVAGSAIPMAVIYLVAHRSGSRSFLTVGYHQAMGVLNAILVVALILLAFLFIAHRGIMEEVGISLIAIGALMGIFIWPAMVSSWYIEDLGVRLMGHRAVD